MTPLLFAALLTQPAAAPTAGEPRTITISVVDDKGNPVRTLSPQDVAVQENGVARELSRLEVDARPLTVALVMDSSAAVASSFRLNFVDAALQFLLRLPEGSRYAIWTTGDRPTRIYDWGDNRGAAARALRRVIPQGGNTVLDALVEVSRDLKVREDARSAIVVVTGSGIGFANYDRRQVVDLVEDHPATVLAVVLDEGRAVAAMPPPGDEVGGADYDYALSSLAKSSGGVRETVLSAMAVERALRVVAAHLAGQYRVTYLAGSPRRDAKVEVTVALPGVKVRVGDPRR